MNKCQIAEYFDVSRPTVAAWVRRGAPVEDDGSMDPERVARWRFKRDMERPGPESKRLRTLIDELNRRLTALDKRTERVNEMPADAECEPGMIKAAIVSGLMMERELLNVAHRIFDSPPSPVTLLESILAAHDSARGEDEQEEGGSSQ